MSYCTKKIAVVFIIRENGKYLFQKRMHTGWHDGYYVLPGGHVEEGETLLEASVRELFEELDIIVQPQDLNFKLVKPEKTHVSFFFEIKKYSGKIRNKEPEKHADLSFLSLQEPGIYPDVIQELKTLEQGCCYLEEEIK